MDQKAVKLAKVHLFYTNSMYADGSVELYLQKYVLETFQSFLKEEPEAEIGWSTFAKFKPHNVKLAGEPNEPISLWQMCEYWFGN